MQNEISYIVKMIVDIIMKKEVCHVETEFDT